LANLDEKKKEIVPVVESNDVIPRKKTLKEKLIGVFIADDIENVKEYAFEDVIKPGIKNLIVDCVAMLILGDSSYGRRSSKRRDRDRVSYETRYKYGDRDERDRSRRRRYDDEDDEKDDRDLKWDEVRLTTAAKAEKVLDAMHQVLRDYEEVTVKDFLDLCGQKSTVFDDNWGWISLRGVDWKRDRGGYYLTLPEPKPLD